MKQDFLDFLRKQKLLSLRRSITASENSDNRVVNTALQAQQTLSGDLNGEMSEEYLMRGVYTRAMEEYTRQSNWGSHGAALTPHGKALWKRVVTAQKASGLLPKDYIKVQFTFYHDSFKRAPKPQELTTDAAIVRAASVAPRNVVTNNIQADINLTDLFRRCEKQMNDIMRSQNISREEVYKLVKAGLVNFPESYLRADPLWLVVNEQR